MVKTVIDASALLALLNGEPGADVVAQALPGGVMSAVNVSEVVAKLYVVWDTGEGDLSSHKTTWSGGHTFQRRAGIPCGVTSYCYPKYRCLVRRPRLFKLGENAGTNGADGR